jgi:hypothetical protein
MLLLSPPAIARRARRRKSADPVVDRRVVWSALNADPFPDCPATGDCFQIKAPVSLRIG